MARAAAHEPTANPALASTGQPEPESGERLIAPVRPIPSGFLSGGMAGDGAALPPGRHPKHGDG